MALDIHLAKNRDEASRNKSAASFEQQPHELIFHRFGLPESKFPLFRRMENYYEDAKYDHEELQALSSEVKEIAGLFAGNNQINSQLNGIISACEAAQNKKLSIWVFCD